MKVTVYDEAPEAEADITVEQIESYLRRTGWSVLDIKEPHLGGITYWDPSGTLRGVMFFNGDDLTPLFTDPHCCMSDVVTQIASVEKRQPSAVLADIAREEIAR